MRSARRKATESHLDNVDEQENTPIKSVFPSGCSPPKIPRYDPNGILITPITPSNCTPNKCTRELKRKSPTAVKSLSPTELFKSNGLSPYQELKKALHTEATTAMPCRQSEFKFISTFLEETLLMEIPASLYISGAPGTGKSACLTQIVETFKYKAVKPKFKLVHVNCMSVRTSAAIFQVIWEKLDLGNFPKSTNETVRKLKDFITSPGPMILFVFDEIDQLDSRNQQVLYTLFELPALNNSRAVLIGIANALDLTDRCLPRLQVSDNKRPQLLHFPPYTKEDIVTIINSRINSLSANAQSLLKPAAILYCARKVSALSGDARKALEICRRAVELVAATDKKDNVLLPRGNDGLNPGSPRKSPTKLIPQSFVDVPQVVAVVNEIYGNNLVGNESNCENSLPLQQKLLLCSLFLAAQSIKSKQVTISKLQEIYTRVCKAKLLDPVNQSEFQNLCSLVETRGLLQIKRGKDLRQSNVMLRVDVTEIEYALKDRALLSSILQDPSLVKRKLVF